MKLVLVPGFWLDASSWDRITPALEDAGHDVTALTLPGLESVDADRSAIGLADHVAVVADAVVTAGEPVVLVGSSFAGTLVQIVTDQHPESVALAVYIDAVPKPVEPSDEPAGDEIPFSWDKLTADEQRDLTDDQRVELERTAIPFPAQVVRDGWDLGNARFGVPALIVATAFSPEELEEWKRDHPGVADELDAYADLTLVELPTSHWPQLTRPDELAQILLDAI